jgi:hypothetical protein
MSAASLSSPLKLRRGLFSRAALTSDTGVLLMIALASFVVHMLVSGNYGYFRDELYYMAAGRHLAFGYVEYPSMIALLAALMNVIAGDALVAIHLIPALAGAALIVITGLMARELGGGRYAQWLAALGTTFALVFMGTASIFSMDVLDELWWAAGAYVLIRLIKEERPRLWLVFGLVCGLGLLTKLTILAFGLGIVVGVLLTPRRADFRTRWPWLGGLIACAFLAPYIVWNAANNWATWEFWHHYGGISDGSPLSFLANQLFLLNPFTIPLWVAGLVFFLRRPQGKPYRALGWMFVTLFLLFLAISFKSYFLAPAYPPLFAGGAIVFEQAAQRRRWVKPVYVPILILSGLLLASLAMPVLPPSAFIAGYGWLSGAGGVDPGQNSQGRFPQYLGDRFGWDTMTATVARVYDALPVDQRAQACILTTNYGEAGALQFLGTKDHLPPVISGHNNYFLWGQGSCTGNVLIVVDETQNDSLDAHNLGQSYASVRLAATNDCQYCQPEEFQASIFVCTQPLGSLQGKWQALKHYN